MRSPIRAEVELRGLSDGPASNPRDQAPPLTLASDLWMVGATSLGGTGLASKDNDDQFIANNAAFVDLVIRRWERIIDFHTSLRHGMFDPENPPTPEGLQTDLDGLDASIASLRTAAKKAKRTFPLDQLISSYGLDPVEAQILELAVIPQIDLSFRQRVARYNNNILYDFVDVDIALGLLFASRVQRLQARRYFGSEAPLIAHKLLSFQPPKDAKGSGLLAQELRPPERLADYVLCRRSLESALRPVADLVDPIVPMTDVALSEEVRSEVDTFIRHFAARHGGELSQGPFPPGGGLTIALVGESGTGKTMLAHAIAHALGRPLIAVDSGRLAAMGERADRLIDSLFTEASVMGAVLLLDRCEPLFSKGNARLPAVLGELDRFGGLAILCTVKPDELDPGVERHVAWQKKMEMPDPELRTMIWNRHIPRNVEHEADVDIEDLGTRYELTGAQIRSACALAEKRVLASPEAGGKLTFEMMKNAAMAQLRADMEEYSVQSKVTLTLKDLVLPKKEKMLIQEVLDACKNRVFVMSKWGFGRRLVTGKGICVLFKGEPGTGKTLCAEILARELGMRLYQIAIPKIVSKYIGETEKNISKIFYTARANHSMLLFDEADALFTKRVSVESATDRFSNMEVNLLLQEIERFEGITILTTNLDKNIDDAFSRRINFKIDFPFPEANHRALIWKGLFPKECPTDRIDFDWLGESYELSGGFIKNAVVRAAYRAASAGTSIGAEDIEFAAEQECRSAGKLFRTTNHGSDW